MDYSALDGPEISLRIFHPRPEWSSSANTSTNDISIPVGDQIVIGARFYIANKEAPNIIFFHGNGEIVADYEDIGPIFNRMGINFLPVDYRGYGRSGENPR